MPTSVEKRNGYVRYWLKGIIDRPWRFDITTKAAFTMIEHVDINTSQLLVSCYLSFIYKEQFNLFMQSDDNESFEVCSKICYLKDPSGHCT